MRMRVSDTAKNNCTNGSTPFPQTVAKDNKAAAAIANENDLLHIKNLPDLDGVLNQRDSELFLSYLTVPYMRLPLVLVQACQPHPTTEMP